jgi:hypothetical protein
MCFHRDIREIEKEVFSTKVFFAAFFSKTRFSNFAVFSVKTHENQWIQKNVKLIYLFCSVMKKIFF